jgi:hypothetical protein
MGQISSFVDAINLRCDPFTTETEDREFTDRITGKISEFAGKKGMEGSQGLVFNEVLG